MPWGRLDDRLHDNGKVWSFSDKAFRVWVYSISYCNKKRNSDPDGRLTEAEAMTVCRLAGATRVTIDELVAKAGWEQTKDGYLVHDFPKYSPKVDTTGAVRQARHREKQRTGNENVTRDSNSKVTKNVAALPYVRADPVPVPDPVPRTPSHEQNPPIISRTTTAPRAREGGGSAVVAAVVDPEAIREREVERLRRDYGEEWFEEAVHVAVVGNHDPNDLRYIAGILRNWRRKAEKTGSRRPWEDESTGPRQRPATNGVAPETRVNGRPPAPPGWDPQRWQSYVDQEEALERQTATDEAVAHGTSN